MAHRCTAQSAANIAAQIDSAWRYEESLPKNYAIPFGFRGGQANIVTPMGPKTIPTFTATDGQRMMIACPYTGEQFIFRRMAGRSRVIRRVGGLDAGSLAAKYGITPQGAGQYAFDASGIAAQLPPGTLDTLNGVAGTIAGWSSMTEQQQTATELATTNEILAAIPVIGWIMAGLLELVEAAAGLAGGGPGCCGTDSTKPFGSCDPSSFGYDQWYGPPTNPSRVNGQDPPPPVGTFEAFAYPIIKTTFTAKNNCFSWGASYMPVALAVAQASWNATHSPSVKRTISYVVNSADPLQSPSDPFYQPYGWAGLMATDGLGRNPIEIAMNVMASANSQNTSQPASDPSQTVLPVGSLMSITINDGPSTMPVGVPGYRGSSGPGVYGPAASAGVSGKQVAVATVGTAAAAVAAGFLYSMATHQPPMSVARAVWNRLRSGAESSSRSIRRIKR